MKIFFITLLFGGVAGTCTAQNNPQVFYGGVGDGVATNNYIQPTVLTFTQGGIGDGHSTSSYAQQSANTLYLGGNGDGFNSGNYMQSTNLAFVQGGIGDGFSSANYAQTTNLTFTHGGIGDGWASVKYNMGTLPVELIAFNGTKVEAGHLLTWHTAGEFNMKDFTLERAADSRLFTFLNTQNAKNDGKENQYQYLDVAPMLGNNFYRLKINELDGKSVYSNTVLLRLTQDGKQSFLLYPNPTATLLNVTPSGLAADTKLDVTLMDITGKVVMKTSSKGNSMLTLNVQHLAAASYLLVLQFGAKQEVIRFVKD